MRVYACARVCMRVCKRSSREGWACADRSTAGAVLCSTPRARAPGRTLATLVLLLLPLFLLRLSFREHTVLLLLLGWLLLRLHACKRHGFDCQVKGRA